MLRRRFLGGPPWGEPARHRGPVLRRLPLSRLAGPWPSARWRSSSTRRSSRGWAWTATRPCRPGAPGGGPRSATGYLGVRVAHAGAVVGGVPGTDSCVAPVLSLLRTTDPGHSTAGCSSRSRATCTRRRPAVLGDARHGGPGARGGEHDAEIRPSSLDALGNGSFTSFRAGDTLKLRLPGARRRRVSGNSRSTNRSPRLRLVVGEPRPLVGLDEDVVAAVEVGARSSRARSPGCRSPRPRPATSASRGAARR